MNNIDRNIESANKWILENRPTCKLITLDEVIKRSNKGNLLGTENSKTKKGNKDGVLTGILYLAPHKITGFNYCPMAKTCIKDCLFNAGRGRMQSVTRARIIKTLCFLLDRPKFIKHIENDIAKLRIKANKLNFALAIRLNGTSDININKYFGHLIGNNKDVFFYDYTKVYNFVTKNTHQNYDLTFSFDGTNLAQVQSLLIKGFNVSVVFKNSWVVRISS